MTMREIADIRDNLPERSFQAMVNQLLDQLAWLHYHTHDSRRSQAGYPDVTALKAGRIWIGELKSEHGRVTPEQERWLDAWEETGVATVGVYRPRDWDRLVASLEV